MAVAVLDNLEVVFPNVISDMKVEFDSHEFILELAHGYQRLYCLALAHYADSNRPFQIVHGEIANRLNNFPDLVSKDGRTSSNDIFGQRDDNQCWRRN